MSAPRISILVVDDDPDLLRLMQIRLTAAGYAVSTAESAERALAQGSAPRPPPGGTGFPIGGLDGLAPLCAGPRSSGSFDHAAFQ